jgi:L-lactate dehydrogenase complex protein LldG
MSSREKILKAIKQNKPDEVPLPSVAGFQHQYENVVQKYINTLSGIGGKAVIINSIGEVKAMLLQKQQQGVEVVNGIEAVEGYNILNYASKTPAEVEQVDTVFIKGEIAVAESGAVWIPEKNMVNRMLPFICQHLVIIVEGDKVVGNMHEAYARLKVDEDGYGAFIAGPSKTADIEQSLVIGAHGPLSLQVFIVVRTPG